MITLKNNSRGFTLIELLVVITIIGILATGATSVYTSQIQKARDTTRISDTKALQNAVEQVYQDSSVYPTALTFAVGGTVAGQTVIGVNTYLPRFPKDPKMNQTCNNAGLATATVICGYSYKAGTDQNGISWGTYEVSTALESLGNVTSRAATDTGDDANRLEVWVLKEWATGTNINTKISGALASGIPTTGIKIITANTVVNTSPTADADQILIYWN